MTKFKITKRDVLFFFLGVIAVIIIEMIFNWQSCKNGFIEGWNAAKTEVRR
ncbi:MAG: hypothetical protein AB1777_12025 [Bacteroidota bacterium]